MDARKPWASETCAKIAELIAAANAGRGDLTKEELELIVHQVAVQIGVNARAVADDVLKILASRVERTLAK